MVKFLTFIQLAAESNMFAFLPFNTAVSQLYQKVRVNDNDTKTMSNKLYRCTNKLQKHHCKTREIFF